MLGLLASPGSRMRIVVRGSHFSSGRFSSFGSGGEILGMEGKEDVAGWTGCFRWVQSGQRPVLLRDGFPQHTFLGWLFDGEGTGAQIRGRETRFYGYREGYV